jgi:glutamine phosphoribosylpyrophosphate amidotransferase
MHTREELIAPKYIKKNTYTPTPYELDTMARDIGVESISYLSVASMKIETQRLGFATACM